jgi:hypothetical protein
MSRVCIHGKDLEVVLCLACRVEGFRGFAIGTITVEELPRSLEAVASIRSSIGRALKVPEQLLREPPPREQRCWQCAALGVVTRCIPGEIYCAPHREAVERTRADWMGGAT